MNKLLTSNLKPYNSTNLQDLIETSHNIHYAQYRSTQIRGQNGRPDSFLACDEFYESRIENAKRTLAEEMQRKEDEMRQKFVAKVREKEASLRYVVFAFGTLDSITGS
jgi:septin family protein